MSSMNLTLKAQGWAIGSLRIKIAISLEPNARLTSNQVANVFYFFHRFMLGWDDLQKNSRILFGIGEMNNDTDKKS